MWKINSLGTALSTCNLFFSSVKLQSNKQSYTHNIHVHTQKARDFTVRLSPNLRIFIRNFFSLKKGLNKINSPLVAVTKVIKRNKSLETMKSATSKRNTAFNSKEFLHQVKPAGASLVAQW